MYRFVDLTAAQGGLASCAFLSTVTDTFVRAGNGLQTFDDLEDFDGVVDGERLRRLVPADFVFGDCHVGLDPVSVEREACARIADQYDCSGDMGLAMHTGSIADRIRARKGKP